MLMTTLVLLCGGILPTPVRIRLGPTAVTDNVNDDPRPTAVSDNVNDDPCPPLWGNTPTPVRIRLCPTSIRDNVNDDPNCLLSSESIATLLPIEGHKWFVQISNQWESQKNRFTFISFGKVQFLPRCIWDLLFMSYRLRFPANESPRISNLHWSLSANFGFTSLHLRSPVHVVPPLIIFLCCGSALNGMLYKLAPKPVENLYLPDAPDVKAAKEEFLKLFRNNLDHCQ